mgnify:CR=1 FL=1
MIAANVKIQEIRHGTLPQPVEQIAERAPNHEPEGGCRQAAVASMDPDKEAGDYSERERHQRVGNDYFIKQPDGRLLVRIRSCGFSPLESLQV